MRLVLLGPPGAGKGTQAVRIAEVFQVPHVATGDLFRDNVKQATTLGQEAQTYMSRGDLVPDDVVIRMVQDRLHRPDAEDGFVLDGFPRTVPQAEALEEFLAGENRPLDVVLRFRVAEDMLVDRIVKRRTCPQCGAIYHLEHAPPLVEGVCDRCGGQLVQREDDTEEVVRRRLEEYHTKTQQLERYYWERGLLRDVDATGSVSEVSQRAMSLLDNLGSTPPPPEEDVGGSGR